MTDFLQYGPRLGDGGRQPWEKPHHTPLQDAFTGIDSSWEHTWEKEQGGMSNTCTSLQQWEKSLRASPIPGPGAGGRGKLTGTAPPPLPKEASTSLA